MHSQTDQLWEREDRLSCAVGVIFPVARYFSQPRTLKAARMRVRHTPNAAAVPSNGMTTVSFCVLLELEWLLILLS